MFFFAKVILKCVVMCHGLFNIFQSTHNNKHISQSLIHFVTLWFHCREVEGQAGSTQLLYRKQEIFAENTVPRFC